MRLHSIVNRLSRRLVLSLMLLSPALCHASDFSFSGTFTRDNQVQLFEFTVAPGATVTIRTLSYAGGTTASGQSVNAGGFDPVLAIARIDTGLVFIQKDDGAVGTVPVDPTTGKAWDVYFKGQQTDLGPGTYILILTQFDDYPKSFYLANRFQRDGNPTFTSSFPGVACPSGTFKDASVDLSAPNSGAPGQVSKASTAHCRDGHWAVEFLNAWSVQPVTSEPAMLSLPKVSPPPTSTVLGANGATPACEAAGITAIVVDEQGKMLPAPDCIRRLPSTRPTAPNAAAGDATNMPEPTLQEVKD